MSLLVSILALGVLQSGPAQVLARLKSEAPIVTAELPVLKSALTSPDPEVQRTALRFWAGRGGEAWDALKKDVEEMEPYDYIRLQTFSRSVVGSVERALDSPEAQIRREGMRTLCALGSPATRLLYRGFVCGNTIDITYEEPSWQALRRRVPLSPFLAMELVGDTDPNVVLNVLRHLDAEDKATLQPAIQKLLTSRHKLMRAVGLSQVTTVSDRDVLQWIAPLIDDSDEEIAQYASSLFIEKLQDPEALFEKRSLWSSKVRAAFALRIGYRDESRREAMLITLLQDASGEVRSVALERLSSAVGTKRSPLSEPQLRQFLLDPHGGVRAAALRELYERKVADIIELQRIGLTDPSSSVRSTAAWCSMHNFDLSLTEAVVRNLEMGDDSDWMLCRYFSHPANDRFLDGWLESPCVYVRQTATLATNPDKERERFLPRLLKAARDSDPEVLRYAVSGLVECGGPQAAAAIRAIGLRSEGELLIRVVEALGMSKDRESIAFLKSCVESSDRALSRAAVKALKQLTDSLIPPAR